ncbi:MAG TPA: alkaline phosphatase family protein, partial [Gemmatimonadaceae bacterium]|nr:alkaline phosphatase family protein [Gemmatimonadaceae bacterium]
MPRVPKVIVIGLDGLEPSIVEPMLLAGELPNLARLRRLGGYGRLATTTPAQTPVAWASFATGVNPGGHGVFDFLRRDPATYLPDLALSRFQQPSALLPPRAVNLRRGTPIWDHLAARDIPSVVLRCPGTFPPDATPTRMLSGMGVPDLRGGLGTATLMSSDPGARAAEAEQLVKLEGEQATFRGDLIGPRDPQRGTDVVLPVKIRVAPDGERVTLESGGEPKSLELLRGAWSDWLRVRFRTGLLGRADAVMRLLLLRTRPHLEIYVSPANFDPRRPLYPISHPAGYAAELAREMGGSFFTAGMVEDHGGLTNGRFGEAEFLSQCEIAMREREAMMRYELARLDEGFFFILFDTPDRVQHMFWRFREPSHPANRAAGDDEQSLREWSRVIEEHYRRCDAVVGEAMAAMDDRTLFLVVSDHGFSSFFRGVNLNTWLHAHGYLALRSDAVPDDSTPDFLREVDWGRTRAYALGLGSIYLNVAGREREGIVAAGEADALAERLATELSGTVDHERGTIAILGALTRRTLYRGPYAGESPDVVVAFNAGYRVSWRTALGGFGRTIVEDNTRRWGGDHIVSPTLVPGVCFANRAIAGRPLGMMDLAPTVLAAFGISVPRAMEGT